MFHSKIEPNVNNISSSEIRSSKLSVYRLVLFEILLFALQLCLPLLIFSVVDSDFYLIPVISSSLDFLYSILSTSITCNME